MVHQRIFLLFIVVAFSSHCAAQDGALPQQSTKKTNETKLMRLNNRQYRKWVSPQKPEKKKTPPVVKDAAKEQLLKKTIRDMTLDELQTAKQYAQSLNKKDLVKKYDERMLVITNDQELLCQVRLELADLYFEEGDMKQAGKMYQEYVKFYPGSKQRDYAEYKAILTRFYARLKPPLDQTKTRKTLMLANRYLDRGDVNKYYTSEVEKIRKDCYLDLYHYEVDIFYHYYNRGRWAAAQTRLQSIKEDLMPMLKELEPKVLELEGMLAYQQNDIETANKKLHDIEATYQEYVPHDLLTLTQSSKKKSFLDRF